MPPQGAQNGLPHVCADEMYAPIAAPGRDDVASGPVLHAVNRRVKARRGPPARAVALQQDKIHDVGRRTSRGGPRRGRRTRCRCARLHGTRRNGTRTAPSSCGRAVVPRRRRLFPALSAARPWPPRARGRAAALPALRADRCRTSGPSPGSSERRGTPHRTQRTRGVALRPRGAGGPGGASAAVIPVCGDFCDGRVTNAGGVNPRTVSKEQCDCVSLLGPLGEPAIVAIQAAANDARAATAEIHGLLRGGTLDADYSGISAARRMDIEPTSEGGQWSGSEKGRSASHMGEFARVRPACIVTQCDWSCLIACAGLASPSRSVQSFGPGPHFSRTACNWVPCYRHHPHFCRCAGVIAST